MLFFKKYKYKYILHIEGMKCGACEAHVNDLIRRNLKNINVRSSHLKNECAISSMNEIDINFVISLIEKEGYKVIAHSFQTF